MGKFRVKVTEQARNHIKQHIKSGNQSSVKRIERILIELSKHPESGIGKPERLKYELNDFWSRRINKKTG